MNNQPQYVEVSVDLAAGEIGVNRGDNQRLGPLLDHPGVSLDLERMWRLMRVGLGVFLLAASAVLVALVCVELNRPITHCVFPVRAWAVTQALAQVCAVAMSWFCRWLLRRAGDARGCKEMTVALAARILNVFLFVWFIMGMVWGISSFGDQMACYHEMPLTWGAMLGLLLCEMAIMAAGTAACLFSCLVVVSRMLVLSRDPVRDPRRDGASTEEISSNTEMSVYSENDFAGDQDDAKCVVCLGEYEAGDELRKLRCGHQFHVECVDEWLRRHKTCPLCVQEIDVEPR